MITGMRGVVLLDAQDAGYLAELLQHDFEALAGHGMKPTAQVTEFHRRLTNAVASASESGGDTRAHGSEVDAQQDSVHLTIYDLVDSAEAAKILGCSTANVRDLGKRGRLPRHRAGRGWVYPAAAVVARAEKRAARRG